MTEYVVKWLHEDLYLASDLTSTWCKEVKEAVKFESMTQALLYAESLGILDYGVVPVHSVELNS